MALRLQAQALISDGANNSEVIPDGVRHNPARPEAVAPVPVAFNDNVRRAEQMRNQMAHRTEEELQQERERQLAFLCYSICLIVTISSPYHNCNDYGKPSVYTFDYKSWNVVFIIICLLHLQKEWCYERINHWYMEDLINL